MRTIVISGSDTEIGKTYVSRLIVKLLLSAGFTVQYVKPVETGIAFGMTGDAELVGRGWDPERFSSYTLNRFATPLAPVDAAWAEGETLRFREILEKIMTLPRADYRIIETAGGLGVPLDENGEDGLSMACALEAEALLLVVQNRMGAINQSRMVFDYVKGRVPSGIVLNQSTLCPESVHASHLKFLQRTGIPLFGDIAVNAEEIQPTEALCQLLSLKRPVEA